MLQNDAKWCQMPYDKLDYDVDMGEGLKNLYEGFQSFFFGPIHWSEGSQSYQNVNLKSDYFTLRKWALNLQT